MRLVFLSASAVALLAVAGCQGQTSSQPPPEVPSKLVDRAMGVVRMDYQPKLRAQEASPIWPDGFGMRPPPAGTVARGFLKADDALYRGLDETGKPLAVYPVAVDRALVNRGRERFDIYWNSIVSKMALVASADVAAHLGPTTPDVVTTSLNDVIGWLSAVDLPRFAPLSESCSAARTTNPTIAARCAKIANVLMNGDSYIAESVGLGIAERLAPANSPQAAQIAERIKRARYQRDIAGQIIAGQLERDKFSRELIKLMATQRREQDVFLAVIRWGGQPTEPGSN